MSIRVGEVIAVQGVKVTLKIFDESNKDVLFYGSEKLKGISIREYIMIQRGFKDIICIVEGEELDERRTEKDGDNKIIYIRKVQAKPVGYFERDIFNEGIKYLPMIKDPVYLVSEQQVSQMFGNTKEGDNFVIGKLLKENLPIALPWQKLFNSHIGIFGNTGSGKSNTLSKLYTTLFSKKINSIKNKSQFIILDFNGEYTRNQLINKDDKEIFDLSTKDTEGRKIPIPKTKMLNSEVLCLLFKATTNTQTPFIKRVVNGWDKYQGRTNSLANYFKSTFKKVFTAQFPKREAIEPLRSVVEMITNSDDIINKLNKVQWHSKNNTFTYTENLDTNLNYFNGGDDSQAYINVFKELISSITVGNLDFFDELIIRSNLQLINDLLAGYIQFDYIQPLLKRIDAAVIHLKKVIEVSDEEYNGEKKLLTVISFKRSNQEIKKIISLLVVKNLYEYHKNKVQNPLDSTIHFIIDEAHNVLSQQSVREQESWKDYRLELFEEIIKEGRKFGVFLTIASQRPADISPTIMSQIHNFFIHRLINDKDLQLLDNTITTLDYLSRNMIPSLSKGCSVITGTAFDIPIILQVDRLTKEHQPDSEDVNLEQLWS